MFSFTLVCFRVNISANATCTCLWITHELWMCASKLICKSTRSNVFFWTGCSQNSTRSLIYTYNYICVFFFGIPSFNPWFLGFTSSYTMDPPWSHIGRSRLKSDVAAAVLAAEAPETRTLRAPYRQLMPNEVPAEWES